MAETDIEVKGLSEILKALDKLPVAIERKVVRAGLRHASLPMKQMLADIVPTGNPWSSWKQVKKGFKRTHAGALKRSIRLRSRNKAGLPSVVVSVGDRQAWYAHIVEGGAKPHLIRRRGKKTLTLGGGIEHPGYRGRLFLKRAFEQNEREAVDTFSTFVRERIPKEWARLERKAAKLP
jgi:HK97 gp10 family phage protein